MAKPAVIVVGADKGGVGKTTVSRTLLDYFTAHHTPTRAFDSEAPKGTLKRFHPDPDAALEFLKSLLDLAALGTVRLVLQDGRAVKLAL